MDPHENPYTPGAGAKPPALVGRDEELAAFDVRSPDCSADGRSSPCW